jgi:hypothetical protein
MAPAAAAPRLGAAGLASAPAHIEKKKNNKWLSSSVADPDPGSGMGKNQDPDPR